MLKKSNQFRIQPGKSTLWIGERNAKAITLTPGRRIWDFRCRPGRGHHAVRLGDHVGLTQDFSQL